MSTFPGPGHFPAPTSSDPDDFDGPVAAGAHDPLGIGPAGDSGFGNDGLLLDDPTVAALPDQPGPVDNPLEALRAEFAKASTDLAPPPRTWGVDARPGWAAQYRVDIAEVILKGYRQRCIIKGRRSVSGEPDYNEVKLGALLAAHYNAGLTLNGQPVLDDAGDPMTFRSREFLTLAGAKTAADAVVKWYVTDGSLIALSRALLNAAGYLDDATEVDPGPSGR